MTPSRDPVQARIEAFARRFGAAHLSFACHAAFPLALTPDLGYRLWRRFRTDVSGEDLGVPWIAVSDLLLSSLCHEVGCELYEMREETRRVLRARLVRDPALGPRRREELNEFLLQYVARSLHSADAEERRLALHQQWVALAYARPGKDAEAVRRRLAEAEARGGPDRLQLKLVREALDESLPGYEPLLARPELLLASPAVNAGARALAAALQREAAAPLGRPARREPLLPYRHNVRHLGQQFHVQTEDAGPARTLITTQVFLHGVILRTDRASYDPAVSDDVVLRLMQAQHKAALRQIRDGAFDEGPGDLSPPAPGPSVTVAELGPPDVPPAASSDAAGLPIPLRGDGPAARDEAGPPARSTTGPYNPVLAGFERAVGNPIGLPTITDEELIELVDLAVGTLDPTVAAGDPGSGDEAILELEAEPPSDEEVEELRTLSATPPSATTPPDPNRVAILAPTGGYMARQRYSSPPRAPDEQSPPLDSDLSPEPTRTHPGVPGRGRDRRLRSTARRLDPSPFRPRPTAEGVVVQRPLIVTERSVVDPNEARPLPPAPGPLLTVDDQRSLDQVILAYLAEDPREKP